MIIKPGEETFYEPQGNCVKCVHYPVCDLWSWNEGQDACEVGGEMYFETPEQATERMNRWNIFLSQ